MKNLFYLFLFCLCNTAYSQSLSVFDIDTTNFPIMKAKFIAYDKDGKKIRPNIGDFSITENGQPRTVLNVTCPTTNNLTPLSAVVVFDVSLSMDGIGLELEKSIAKTWLNMLSLGQSDCAFTSFNHSNYINQDFTTNKNKLLNSLNELTIDWGTDYNKAMIDPAAGGILIAKTGKHKRIIIFLTDGQPNDDIKIETMQIYSEACKNNITIYCLTLYAPVHPTMKEFSSNTHGLYFEYIDSKEKAESALNNIFFVEQNNEFCEIEWKSESICKVQSYKTELNLLSNNSKNSFEYVLPENAKEKLEFFPSNITFKDVIPGSIKDTTITVTARNADFNLKNITSSNSAIKISPNNFNLSSGQSKTITLSFIPVDSGFVYSKLTFEDNLCSADYYVSGGFQGKKPTNKTIRLLHPNGREYYAVGGDTLITWDGIPETDTVRLEYSIDNGSSWKLITNSATNFKYIWKNIPKPESNQCLVRIKQLGLIISSDIAPKIEWERTIGGISDMGDTAYSIIQTKDGGFIVAGASSLYSGADSTCLIKFDLTGKIEWKKNYGDIIAYSLQQTKDNGFILAGASNYGSIPDISVLKLDLLGNMQWQKQFGGTKKEIAYSIQPTTDGGYIFAGSTNSEGSALWNSIGMNDFCVVKLDSLGKLLWLSILGGEGDEWANCIQQTYDGGYIVAGRASSYGGDVKCNKGHGDGWVVKLYSNGIIEWKELLGGGFNDEFTSIQQTRDGGYIVAGISSSYDGDIKNPKGAADFWIVKLKANGQIEWRNNFGGKQPDQPYSIQQTFDGGYIVAGETYSDSGEITENKGGLDIWVIKIDESGQLEWQKTIGGSNNDGAYSIKQTIEGGYIIAGFTTSNDGDVSNNTNPYNSNYWIIKLSPEGSTIIQEDISDSVFSIVAPHASADNIDMKNCLLGMVKDSVITNIIENTGTYPVRIDSIYFTGADSSNFRLLSHVLPQTINPGDKITLEFGFGPSRIGLHSADMIILTQSDTLFKKIIGTGYEPQLAVSAKIIDFGQLEIGNERTFTDTALVKNISLYPITINKITQMGPEKKQFEILSSLGSFTLQPNEERKLTLKFKPIFGGRTTGQVAFEYSGVGSPAVVGLFGTGIGGNLRIANDSAYPGDTRNLKLIMEKVKPEGMSAIAPNFEATIRFQNTILVSINNPNWTISNDSTYLTIKGKFGTSNEIAQIPLVVGLGNVEETAVDIINFVLKDDAGNNVDYDFESESGIFKLLGICPSGGNRFINPSGKINISSIKPNPSDNEIEVQLELVEKTGYKLIIVNSNGQTVREISRINSNKGIASEIIEVTDLASGVYNLILQTESERIWKRFLILK